MTGDAVAAEGRAVAWAVAVAVGIAESPMFVAAGGVL